MRIESASLVWLPNIIVPRHSGETLTPALPKLRYCMMRFYNPELI
jgi:hypothetical protein